MVFELVASTCQTACLFKSCAMLLSYTAPLSRFAMWLQRYGCSRRCSLTTWHMKAEGDKALGESGALVGPLARVTARGGRINMHLSRIMTPSICIARDLVARVGRVAS